MAEAAGVSQAVLFQRFGSKQRLYFAAMLPPPPSLAAIMGEAPDPGSDQARTYLIEFANRFLEWLDATMPGALRAALHRDFPEALDEAHGPGSEAAVAEAITARLDLLARRGDIMPLAEPEVVAETLLEVLHGQALATLLGGTIADSRAERAIKVIWFGLGSHHRKG